MARFGVAEAENYGGQGGGGFFSLKNDREVAPVRFLINGIEDVEGFAVHEIDVDGKKRYVNCLREYGQPMDVCPCCAAKMPVTVKYFIPLYNIKEEKIQTWERGKQFGAKISSICARFPNLVSHTFEIERNGKPGDTKTSYEIYETGQDDTTLESFDEVPDAMGTIVLDKTFEELDYWVRRGAFPDEGGQANNQPIIRRGSAQGAQEAPRRTPTSGGRREVF